ncbi:hypothetical protein DRQ25_15050 [Candidatus Fermentibacteria bacterium]|nr:MAG: hypothetical protein DRQ25_15050 [Candidatus Fermentibacteria bacterium]
MIPPSNLEPGFASSVRTPEENSSAVNTAISYYFIENTICRHATSNTERTGRIMTVFRYEE